MKRQLLKTAVALLLTSAGIAFAQTAPIKLRFSHGPKPTPSTRPRSSSPKGSRNAPRGAMEIGSIPTARSATTTLVSGVRSGTIDMAMSGNPYFTGLVAEAQRARPAVPVRRRRSRRTRCSTARSAARCSTSGAHQHEGARVLGSRLSQPRQQQAPDRQGRRHQGPEDAHDTEPLAPEGVSAARREPAADAVRRSLRRARVGRDRRPGEPAADHAASKMYEVQKYLSMTRHAYTAMPVVMNKARFDALEPEYQKALLEEARPRPASSASSTEARSGIDRPAARQGHAGRTRSPTSPASARSCATRPASSTSRRTATRC